MSDKATLKGFFETGDVPTEAQFADLIDSNVNTDETYGQSVESIVEFKRLVHANNDANAVKAFTATPTFAFGTDGNDQQMTLTGNVTDFTTSGEVGSAGMNVYLINDGSVRTVVAPTGWTADPTSETHTTAENAINRYQFYTLPNFGTKFYNIHIVKA